MKPVMKQAFTKNLVLALTLNLALAIGLSSVANAQKYSPEALDIIVERASELSSQGIKPVVVFDLDDTLINTRERNLRILHDFASQPAIQTQFADDAAKTLTITVEQIRYLLPDSLKEVGVTNPDFVKAAGDFWLPRFFSDHYCAFDQQNAGAADYVRKLTHVGAKVIYLTGRDIPRMQIGTLFNLQKNGFPTAKHKAELMMKPDPAMDDFAFKQQALAEIKTKGEVIGVFENEPANINLLASSFPSATAIFLDTIHSPKPDVPAEGIFWVKDFNN